MPEFRAGRAHLQCRPAVSYPLSSPQILFAACSENIPGDGASVSCYDSDTFGIRAPSAQKVRVYIDSGASIVSASAPAIELGAGADIENRGRLDSGATYTIQLSGGDDRLQNSGYIAGSISLGNGDNRVELDGGRIDSRLLGGRHSDTLIWNDGSVGGDYTGNGELHLDAILGGDDSQADRLVIDGGRASGSTLVQLNKLGSRAADTQRGIPARRRQQPLAHSRRRRRTAVRPPHLTRGRRRPSAAGLRPRQCLLQAQLPAVRRRPRLARRQRQPRLQPQLVTWEPAPQAICSAPNLRERPPTPGNR